MDGRVLAVLQGAFILVFYSEVLTFLFDKELGPPASWAAYALVAVAAVLGALRRDRARRLFAEVRIAWWLLAFLLLSVLWVPGPSELPYLAERVRSVVFALSLGVLVVACRAPRAARWAVALSIPITVVVLGFDLANPLQFSPIPGRAGGFYINPNRAAFALVFATVLALDVLPRGLRLATVALAGIGVLMTVSRGGALLLAGTLVWAVATGRIPRRHLAIGAGLLVASVLGATLIFPEAVGGVLEAAGLLGEANRFAVQADDESATGRLRFATAALRMFFDSPLVGHGTGASLSWWEDESTHNMTLTFAVEHGTVGLALWAGLFLVLVRRHREALPFALVFGVASLFSHNLLDEFFSLTALTLAAYTPASGLDQAPETPAPSDPPSPAR